MRNLLRILSCFLIFQISYSQVLYEEFHSDKLDETRKLKIQLPRNYNSNIDKKYPLVLVLDGDYLFEPVAGNVDYFSYWEDMPESIVVGIIQGESRYHDCSYDHNTYLPDEFGSRFFEFIGLELVPYLDENFRTAKFIIGVGHDFTANFLNYYLFKNPPLFNGYINLSPDFAPAMEERIAMRLPEIKEEIFYYLATGSDDIRSLRESAVELNEDLQILEGDSFHYYFDNFEGATHYSLVGRGIPAALEKIFSIYRPISKEEFTDVLMKTDTPLHQYLFDKYDIIKNLFSITDNIRINDYIAVATAAEKRKQWDSLKEIAARARKEYPNHIMGGYYMGLYHEGKGEIKRAKRSFQASLDKEEIESVSIDTVLDKLEAIKRDFGI